MELCLEVDDDQVKNLWVRTKGLANVRDSVVGVYCGPPDQEEEDDDIFYS